jgi:hypothetical protein
MEMKGKREAVARIKISCALSPSRVVGDREVEEHLPVSGEVDVAWHI